MQTKDMENFLWLVGQWEGIQGPGIYHEEWEESNGELIGKAFLITKGEIRNVEKLKIHSVGPDILYTADVSHNSSPVSFRLTSENAVTFVFENPAHDFPQKITYQRKGDSLTAVIEAIRNGKVKQIEYNLRKVC